MELLEVYKKSINKKQEYEKIVKNREFDHEFNNLVYSILEGKEYIISNNERLFTELGIKHGNKKIVDFTAFGMKSGYKLRITEKTVEKVEEYMNN